MAQTEQAPASVDTIEVPRAIPALSNLTLRHAWLTVRSYLLTWQTSPVLTSTGTGSFLHSKKELPRRCRRRYQKALICATCPRGKEGGGFTHGLVFLAHVADLLRSVLLLGRHGSHRKEARRWWLHEGEIPWQVAEETSLGAGQEEAGGLRRGSESESSCCKWRHFFAVRRACYSARARGCSRSWGPSLCL